MAPSLPPSRALTPRPGDSPAPTPTRRSSNQKVMGSRPTSVASKRPVPPPAPVLLPGPVVYPKAASKAAKTGLWAGLVAALAQPKAKVLVWRQKPAATQRENQPAR